MTSKLVVNTIEADTGISSVSFASSISMSSTSKFHFSDAGIDIGADTNISRAGSGILAFNINSSEKVRIDSSGRLLIGLTASQTTDSNAHSKLQIATSAGPNIGLGNNSTDINNNGRLGIINFNSNHGGTYHEVGVIASRADADHASNSKPSRLEFYTTQTGNTQATERLRITSGGNVGINDSNPDNQLVVKAVSGHSTAKVTSGDETTSMVMQAIQGIEGRLGMNTNHPLAIYAGGLEKVRIDSSGRLLVGSNTHNTTLDVARFHKASGHTSFSLTCGSNSDVGFHLKQSTREWKIFSDGNLRFYDLTDNAERLRITSGGNIGINRSSPTRTLHISSDDDLTSFTGTGYGTVCIENSQYDSGDYNAIDFTYSGSNNAVARIATKITGSGSSLHFGTSNNYSSGITNEALTINIAGKIGINNSSPAYLLDVTGASVVARFKSSNNNNVVAIGGNNASHLAYMGTDSSGAFLVATGGSVTTRLNINTSGRVRLSGVPGVAGSNLTNISIESDGNLCTQTSLREYKTNITSISDTSWLYNLNPVTFNWKKKTEVNGENVWEDTADDNGTQYGLIAEEVEAVKKEFCYYDNDNKLSGVHYDRLIAPLLKGLQEQKTEIDALKNRITTLEGS